MARHTKKSINKSENIVQRSSKPTDIHHSNSSLSSAKLRDNGMLTNKKLFIHYGKQKQDFRLELVLRRLNAEILESYDEKVNIVITSVSRNIQAAPNPTPLSNALHMTSRGRKLAGLVQKKALDNVDKPKKDFLDIVAEKGIRILQLHSVWKWLRDHHAPLLQEDDELDDEENELRDSKKDLKKLSEPCLKIIDVGSETRPTFYQKCLFQPLNWEETFSQPVEEKTEKTTESTQSKQGDTVKSRLQKSTKAKPQNVKTDAGYCECCRMSYKNIFEHLRSICHREFACNAKNYEEIDQTLSKLSDINSFFTIRMRKQTILERKNSNRKLIKTLSANDFKNECKGEQDPFTKDSPAKEVVVQLLYGNITEEKDVMEEVDLIEEVMDCFIQGEEYRNEYEVDAQTTVHRESYLAPVQEMIDKEGIVGTISATDEPARAVVSIQVSELKMAQASSTVSYCGAQQGAALGAVEVFTLEHEHATITEVDYGCSIGLLCFSMVSSICEVAAPLTHPAVILGPDPDSSDDSDSSDSDSFPKGLTNQQIQSDDNSFRESFGHEFSPRLSSWANSSPLDSQSKYNAFSPFFLDNLNNSHNYSLLTPDYDFPKVDYDPSASLDTSIHHPDLDSPTQYIPSGSYIEDPDSILDLRRCATTQNDTLLFSTLPGSSLSRAKPSLALDRIVGRLFKTRYQIDLASQDSLAGELTSLSDLDQARQLCSGVARVGHVTPVIMEKRTPRTQRISHVTPVVMEKRAARTPRISHVTPVVIEKRAAVTPRISHVTPIIMETRAAGIACAQYQSPDRPCRRAKSVARDSISLTTRFFLN